MSDYDPETYWNRVAQEIEKRGENYLAGDDNPYYRYKRRKFLNKFLDTIDFQSKIVLEVGVGPGGNLKHVATHQVPKKVFGVDISSNMVEIAARNLSKYDVVLAKMDGASLPYPDQAIDVSFTVTMLQHNTDEKTFRKLVEELVRVTKRTIIIMEDIGMDKASTGEFISRPVDVYNSAFSDYGFKLFDVTFLNTKLSRRWYNSIQRRFISSRHQEGDPISRTMKSLIGLAMPITRLLDEMFVEQRDLAKMTFQRT